MKSTINLTDYQFSGKDNPLYQISDHPTNKLARVIEINRAEMLFDIDLIAITATTYFIDSGLGIVVFKEPTLIENSNWNIVKGELTIKLDENLAPVENPDYDSELPESEENYMYELVDVYDQFKTILVGLNMPVIEASIEANDTKGLFNN